MVKTLFASTVLLLCLLLIETTMLSNIPYLPTIPDLQLIAVMYIGLKNGTLLGESAGFISGIMLDFVSASPPGLNCLVRTAAGALCGVFHRTLNSTGILIPMLFGLCITAVKILAVNVISFFFPLAQIVLYKFFSLQLISEAALNMVLCPIMFALLSLFGVLVVKKEDAL
ncbi:MAG: rod shape-determining protein MreD [Spirochaetaceae bacterium]|jgi:rod shape-determining protein MreD|nr:rod shape-determining protein MreD [Spirochaetaceae bacterium]